MKAGEAYLDIVWRQFKKNRFAYWCLVALGPLFLIAIFAPLLASNIPLVFWDGDETLFPWFRMLFNPTEAVDFFFNMALVGFIPWILLAWATNRLWRLRGVPGRWRLLFVAGEYVAIILLLLIVFSIPGVRPKQGRYWSRTFTEEQLAAPDTRSGVYALIPYGPNEQDLDAVYQPPFFRKEKAEWDGSNDWMPHVVGTDDTGRDVLVRMIYGARISMTVGFVAVSIYITIGVIIGAIAGYFGGWVDILISRVVEIVLLFPAFFLILILVGLIGPSIYVIMLVIGVTGWPTIARLIRGEVLKQRAIDYTTAARALGSSHMRIIFRHILPNSLSPALVAAPFGIAGAIVTEAGLSLLGFGVRPPAPSWGALLQLGNSNYSYWWLVVVPSVAIFVTVTIFNLVGSGFRDAMDPRLRM